MRIFLSYSRDDADRVEVLRGDLEDLGHEVWFDRELSGGQSWWDEILDRIEQADVFVLGVTRASVRSEACLSELRYAAAWQRPIVPAQLEHDVDEELAPDPLPALHWMRYERMDKDDLKSLVRTLGAIALPPPVDAPPPRPPLPRSYVVDLRDAVHSPDPMSLADQLLLIHRFEQRVDDTTQADRLIRLLEELRGRRDLLAEVVPKIDELVEQLGAGRSDDAPAASSTVDDAAATGVRAALERHRGLDRVSVGAEISEAHAGKIRKAFPFDDETEELLAAIDMTVFETGGVFLAITDRRLLHKGSGSTWQRPLSSIDPDTLDTTIGGNLRVEGQKLYWNYADLDACTELLRDVVVAARADPSSG